MTRVQDPTTTTSVRRAAGIGAAAGMVLAVAGAFVFGRPGLRSLIDWQELGEPEFINWDNIQELLIIPALCGGFAGGLFGAALWVPLTTRPVPAALLVFCCWWLGTTTAVLAVVGLLAALPALGLLSIGRDGSGAAGLAILLMFAAAAAAVVGSIAGIVVGVKTARKRKRLPADGPPAYPVRPAERP